MRVGLSLLPWIGEKALGFVVHKQVLQDAQRQLEVTPWLEKCSVAAARLQVSKAQSSRSGFGCSEHLAAF